MTDESDDPSKLDDLTARLREAREREHVAAGRDESKGGGAGTGAGLGLRIAVELVAGIAVGVLIGIALDAWLGTRPWLMVVFLFLGAAAGVMNVYRAAKGLDQSVGLEAAKARQERNVKNDERG